MLLENQNSAQAGYNGAPSNEVVANSLGLNEPTPLTIESLSNLQLERYYWLSFLYKDDVAMHIISNATSHGMDSWAMVSQKITTISDMDTDSTDYYNGLEEFMTIGKVYGKGEIIHTVAFVRKEMGLKPHDKNILKSCVADFFARHMVRAEFSVVPEGSKDKPEVIGYVPTFNLNCQL